MMIDTHAHIYDETFSEDIGPVIDRARQAGVMKVLMPNIDSTSIESMMQLAKAYPEVCYPMMGLHPCSVKEDFERELQLVEEHLSNGTFLAIGEIGTDLYWDKSFWKEQQIAFNRQCELALEHKLPVVIHCRESIDETIDLVRPFAEKGLTGVFHCFTGTVEQGHRITQMNFYLGLGGVSTFKNGGLDSVIPHLDRSKLILETDSPYLAPAPNRGKRNEPAYIPIIADKVAEYLDVSREEVAIFTTQNANSLFFPEKLSS